MSQARPREARTAMGRVVDAYSRYCCDHSVPTPSRMDIAILATQAGNLLAGGYDERDITDEALAIATEFDLFHGHRGMTQLQRRVQQRYEDQRVTEHERVIAESREIAPDVAAAMGQPLKDVPSRYGHDPRPKLAPQRQPDSPGARCASCRHWSIEHGPSGCATCTRVGRACAA